MDEHGINAATIIHATYFLSENPQQVAIIIIARVGQYVIIL